MAVADDWTGKAAQRESFPCSHSYPSPVRGPQSAKRIGSPLCGDRLEIDFRRRTIIQGLVQASAVVKGQLIADPAAGIAWRSVVTQIHIFVLDRAPQPLGEDIVQRSPLAVHADLHTGIQQLPGLLRAGKVAALITVPDARLCLS